MKAHKRKADEHNHPGYEGVYDSDENKRPCNSERSPSSSTLSEDGMSNDLLSASDKAAEQIHSQDAMVYREEGSRKSAPLSNGSTASGLVKSPTCYSLGKRSPSLYDQLMSQKPVEPSPHIPVDQDAESSGEEAETSVSDPYDSDQDDYGQFVECFEGLGL